MISLLQRGGDHLLRLTPKDMLVGGLEFVNILLGGHAHGTIIVPNEVAAKVEGDWSCSLKLELISALQLISYSLGILGSCSKVVDIDPNVFVDITILPHPDVQFCLARLETHVPEAVGKSFVPMES